MYITVSGNLLTVSYLSITPRAILLIIAISYTVILNRQEILLLIVCAITFMTSWTKKMIATAADWGVLFMGLLSARARRNIYPCS